MDQESRQRRSINSFDPFTESMKRAIVKAAARAWAWRLPNAPFACTAARLKPPMLSLAAWLSQSFYLSSKQQTANSKPPAEEKDLSGLTMARFLAPPGFRGTLFLALGSNLDKKCCQHAFQFDYLGFKTLIFISLYKP